MHKKLGGYKHIQEY